MTLAETVASSGADLVRRANDRFTQDAVTLPLGLVAALPLGAGRHVAVVADADGRRWTVPLAPDGDRAGEVRRATAGDGVAEAFVALLVERPEALHGNGFAGCVWYAEPAHGERALTVDQTNESLVVGERAMVKWSLRLAPDGVDVPAPALARLEALAAAGFDGTPRPWAVLTWQPDRAAQPLLLATVAAYLPDALDGWDWAVEDVRSYALGAIDLEAALAPATALGALVARLHLAFAANGADELTVDAATAWVAAARADLAEALQLVDGAEGARLSAWAPAIAAGVAALADAGGTPVIDVHGDLHVGQVLRHAGPDGTPSYVVVDFDGNPVLSAADRTARRPAAVDVAGMLASLDHVGRIVLKRTEGVDTEAVERWIVLAENRFLAAYRETLAAAGRPDLLDERLLRPVRLQQECREFLYAVHHLPLWRYVPDGALAALLGEPVR